jgi:hypothetical protein
MLEQSTTSKQPEDTPGNFHRTTHHLTIVKRSFIFPLLLSFFVSPMQAQQSGVFLLDPNALRESAMRIQQKDAALLPAYKRLVKDADKLLSRNVGTVMEKEQTPPSGDKHDYMSMARYYWPDPAKKDGLPYISRDGETNPETGDISDGQHFGRVTSGTWTLALAFHFTGKSEYAEQAARDVRAWFLDSATAMNPNLNYAQYVKGKGDGRPSGIIDARDLHRVVEAIGLIAPSGAWTSEDQARMVAWMKSYLKWLRTHPNGIKESESTNNHGVWYDVQTVAVACFAGEIPLARSILEKAKTERIGKQIEPDGSMPRELARTRPKHYVMFNLEALETLASYGRTLGVDLWNYRSNDGRSLRAALDWIVPYAKGEKEWSWKDIDGGSWTKFYFVFLHASSMFPEGGFEQLARRFEPEKGGTDVDHLILNR